MSSKYIKINLEDLIENYGEDRTKSILADFSCKYNKDVEYFLKSKAIEFSKQSIAKTQLVYYIEDEERPYETKHLVGYFSLSQKIIKVQRKALSNTLCKRIRKFATYDRVDKSYVLPVILIGQIGKNYSNSNNERIEGDYLLGLALQSISYVQKAIGGKIIFLESEDKEKLRCFYERNGFITFGKRQLDRDETNIEGDYLLQWLCYPRKTIIQKK